MNNELKFAYLSKQLRNYMVFSGQTGTTTQDCFGNMNRFGDIA